MNHYQGLLNKSFLHMIVITFCLQKSTDAVKGTKKCWSPNENTSQRCPYTQICLLSADTGTKPIVLYNFDNYKNPDCFKNILYVYTKRQLVDIVYNIFICVLKYVQTTVFPSFFSFDVGTICRDEKPNSERAIKKPE